jgi:hypothetical protein
MDRGSAISLTSPPLIKEGSENKGRRGQGEEYRKKGERRDRKNERSKGKREGEEEGGGVEEGKGDGEKGHGVRIKKNGQIKSRRRGKSGTQHCTPEAVERVYRTPCELPGQL